MNNIILYHANCPDGFAAAFAAWLKFGDTAQYIPVQYGHPVPDWDNFPEVMPATVYILDFSYPRDVLESLAARPDVDRVIVLDHHKTAAAQLAGLCLVRYDRDRTDQPKLQVEFDMDKSGAVLAWEYFHQDRPVPEMFLYIQDRDLWRWEICGSRSVNAGLWLGEERHFHAWETMLENWHCGDRSKLKERGWGILQAQDYTLNTLTRSPEQITGPGGEIGLSVNSPVLQSELGERLLAENPLHEFADIWYERGGHRIHSLRSRPGGIDVSAIAALHGGGGHHTAAGYTHGAACFQPPSPSRANDLAQQHRHIIP